MDNSIPVTFNNQYQDYLRSNFNTTFVFEPVTVDIVKSIILGLKSKSSFGLDGISTNLLTHLEPLLSKPISLIINQSFATGVFPEKLKLAKIISVYKKNDKFLIENYRPISILPSISKVFESAVHQKLYPYFISNNYLHNSQYGFRK